MRLIKYGFQFPETVDFPHFDTIPSVVENDGKSEGSRETCQQFLIILFLNKDSFVLNTAYYAILHLEEIPGVESKIVTFKHMCFLTTEN